MIRNLALDQTKIQQICNKANFTNGLSQYIISLTEKFNDTANSISSTLNKEDTTEAVNNFKFPLCHFE
jgi:hypothetical protein